MKSLKDIFLHEDKKKKYLIQEAELDITSLDAQIDRYLGTYESESQNKEEIKERLNRYSVKEFYSKIIQENNINLQEINISDLVSKILGRPPEEEAEEEEIPEEEPEAELGAEEEPLEGLEPEEGEEAEEELETVEAEEGEEAPAEELEPEEGEEAEEELETVLGEPEDVEAEELPSEEAVPLEVAPMAGDEELDKKLSSLFNLDDEKEEKPIKPRPGGLNLNNFAVKVSNLIKNAENLFDIKSVIIHRASAIVSKNYSDDDKEKFAEILSNLYGLKQEE
tara:strand:- start:1949 stop:2788 length:840 start_codon:yes stop_codon:yes gene_type:complete